MVVDVGSSFFCSCISFGDHIGIGDSVSDSLLSFIVLSFILLILIVVILSLIHSIPVVIHMCVIQSGVVMSVRSVYW